MLLLSSFGTCRRRLAVASLLLASGRTVTVNRLSSTKEEPFHIQNTLLATERDWKSKKYHCDASIGCSVKFGGLPHSLEQCSRRRRSVVPIAAKSTEIVQIPSKFKSVLNCANDPESSRVLRWSQFYREPKINFDSVRRSDKIYEHGKVVRAKPQGDKKKKPRKRKLSGKREAPPRKRYTALNQSETDQYQNILFFST